MTKRDEIVQKYLEGSSVIELASEYSLTRERIYQHLRTLPQWDSINDLRVHSGKQRLRTRRYKDQIGEILRLRRQLKSYSAIGDMLGISPLTVRTLIRDNADFTVGQVRKARNKRIVKDHKNGIKQTALAKKYGLSQSSISAIVIKHG